MKTTGSVEHCWNGTDRGNRRTGREAYPSATVFTKNVTWTDLASNQLPCGERPATLKTSITLNCIKIQSVPRSKHTPYQYKKAVS